jgi:hypothetical protein
MPISWGVVGGGKKELWPEGLQSDYHLLLAICLLPRSTGPVETRDL